MSHSLNSEKELYKRSSKDNEVCVSYYVESNLIGECHGNKRAFMYITVSWHHVQVFLNWWNNFVSFTGFVCLRVEKL